MMDMFMLGFFCAVIFYMAISVLSAIVRHVLEDREKQIARVADLETSLRLLREDVKGKRKNNEEWERRRRNEVELD